MDSATSVVLEEDVLDEEDEEVEVIVLFVLVFGLFALATSSLMMR